MYYSSLWHPSTYEGIVGVASIVVGIVPVHAAGRHHRRRCSMTAVCQVQVYSGRGSGQVQSSLDEVGRRKRAEGWTRG